MEKRSLTKVLTGLILMLMMSAGVFAQEAEWENVSQPLFESIEGYSDEIPGGRGMGGVAVDRHSGDLIAGINGEPFGIYRSKDAGVTWERIDGGNIVGAWVRPGAIQIDQDKPGRMAFFRSSPPAPDKSKDGFTLDGGKTWQPFPKAFGFAGVGGWHHGYVEWSDDTPVNMIAQNRVRPAVQVSSDGGKTFKKMANGLKGVVDMSYTFEWLKANDPDKWKRIQSKLCNGYGLYGKAVLVGRHDGIERAEESTGPFEKVSDLVVTAYTPVRFQDKIYWGGEKGVLISEDGGKTWAVMGTETSPVRQGPFIGADASNMVVVTDEGIYKTTDGGQEWKKVSELLIDKTMWRPEIYEPWTRHCYTWDHTRDLLYVAGVAGSLYKKEIK